MDVEKKFSLVFALSTLLRSNNSLSVSQVLICCYMSNILLRAVVSDFTYFHFNCFS